MTMLLCVQLFAKMFAITTLECEVICKCHNVSLS